MADAQPLPHEGRPLTVNLQILSPSPQVEAMRFPDLAASTTIGELKAKIRERIASRPSDERMRLIYHARFLSRDGDTLLEVFGEDVIRSSDQQTLHLALREDPTPAPEPETATRPPVPMPGSRLPHPNHAPHPAPHVAHPGGGFFVAPGPFDPATQHMGLHAAAQNAMREAQATAYRQHQAAVAMAEERVRRRNEALAQAMGTIRRGEPAGQVEVVTTERTAPNGTHVRITTFGIPPPRPEGATSNEASAPTSYPSGQMPLPRADTLRATQTITDAMHRSASGASLASMANNLVNANRNGPIQPIQPGVTTPLFPGISRHASRTATPDPFTISASQPQAQAQAQAQSQLASRLRPQFQTRSQPQSRAQSQASRGQVSTEVYIVHSPSGPHSLLVNHGSDMYEILVPGSNSGHQSTAVQSNFQPQLGFQAPPGFAYPAPLHPVYYVPPSFPTMPGYLTRILVPTAFPHGYQPPTTFQQPAPQTAAQPQPQAQAQAQPQVQPQDQTDAEAQAQRQRMLQQQLHAAIYPNQAGAAAQGGAPVAAQAPVPAPAVAPAAAPAPAPAQLDIPPEFIRHPGNPNAGAMLAAMWPHIWLVIRLVAFAWWFSYSDPSWERWLSLAIAFVVVVVINTGVFNAVVNDAFNPVRAQLEGMLPPLANAGGQDQQQQQQQQGQNQQGQGENGNNEQGQPDPVETARRLVAQRRIANGTWLRDHARWLERAGVLLLASLAPGVAERHIRQLEEQEIAARAAAQAAAAERERLAQEAEAAANQETENNQEGQQNADGENNDNNGQEIPPLIPGLGQDHLQQQQAQLPVDVA
ncbi:hypothetical protein QBC43DRAFT_320900 [Cladorrhinum sp. PSN259]|nr:hypothetical protein QBC43DRAFT_320900 [Cladorrhinum sp. PSN259]